MASSDARAERIALHNQGMVGYTLFIPAQGRSTGEVFHRLGRAEKAAGREPGALVVLVRDSGQLYHQSFGRSTGPVLGADGRGIAIRRLSRRTSPSRSAAEPHAAGARPLSGTRAARGLPNYER